MSRVIFYGLTSVGLYRVLNINLRTTGEIGGIKIGRTLISLTNNFYDSNMNIVAGNIVPETGSTSGGSV